MAATPLPALLSQTLVAYSVEFGDEFGARTGRQVHSVSLHGWSNLWQYLHPKGMSVRELIRRSTRSGGSPEPMLSCYERWRYLTFEPPPGGEPIPKKFIRLYGMEARVGFGSTSGIRKDWIVRPTEEGARVIKVGPSITRTVDRRWSARFDAYELLRRSLVAIADACDVEYPHCMYWSLYGRKSFSPRITKDVSRLPLSALLSKSLAAFTADFDAGAVAPLAVCASLLRVLNRAGVPRTAVPSLTGLTSDSIDHGRSSAEIALGLVTLEPAPNARRRTVVRLTDRGEIARAEYPRRAKAIETAWRKRFGADVVAYLRRSLEAVMASVEGLRAGLAPPEFSIRHPSFGGGLHARLCQEQGEAFVRDPVGSLPHFPVWALTHGWAI